ncbi:MAG: TetR/AcrR family transcriptional regulator [Clostridiaceae bacterium]|nr:TetR/AcrR family transcriptional regulator [Clostridiaceae bacterium]
MMRISKSPHERKQEIIAAALELFLSQGYEKTSVSMIVDHVGVAQGLFYYYFKSKEDVFQEAMRFYTDRLATEVIGELLAPEAASIFERVTAVITHLSTMFEASDLVFNSDLNTGLVKEIDIQLSYYFSVTLIEPVAALLSLLEEKTGRALDDVYQLAAFVVFGIFGLLHGHNDIGHQRMPESMMVATLLARTIGVDVDILLKEKIEIPEGRV